MNNDKAASKNGQSRKFMCLLLVIIENSVC